MSKAPKRRTSLPTGIDKNEMTKEKWKKFINLIANGAAKPLAVKEIKVSHQTVNAYLITEADAVTQYREAQATWIRRKWPLELIEQVMLSIATGMTTKAACASRDMNYYKFLTLALKDPSIKEMYDDAKEVSMESMADEMIEISDESSEDRTGNRINHEVVHRSKLRIDARFRLMQSLASRRYGPRIKQEISQTVNVNHVELLDNARKRREIIAARKKKDRIIAKRKPAEDKTLHVDRKKAAQKKIAEKDTLH